MTKALTSFIQTSVSIGFLLLYFTSLYFTSIITPVQILAPILIPISINIDGALWTWRPVTWVYSEDILFLCFHCPYT